MGYFILLGYYEVVPKIFGTILITGNMLNVGSEEVAKYQESASNLYRVHYLKAEKVVNQKLYLQKNRKAKLHNSN